MTDNDLLILTAIGPDQVGLVEKLSQFISRNGCNIEDSKMAVFCGEFAVIILIRGEGEGLAKIRRDHREIELETGLSVSIKTPSTRRPLERSIPYKLTASCMDHPGVVYHISGILSRFGVNIDSMETQTYSAPVSGTPLFQLEADLAIPVRININDVRECLAELQRAENIDVELTAIKA